jgi:o-succinylbenzoate synthase
LKAWYRKYDLNFKRPAGTSRGVLRQKETWFIFIQNDEGIGIGECPLFRGLSHDDRADYEQKLDQCCQNIEHYLHNDDELLDWPSIRFGIETAKLWLENGAKFGTVDFCKAERGIKTNGLIWMGDESFMQEQIEYKLKEGFSCIKMKIGAIDFDHELSILQGLRKGYSKELLEIRVDANGAFDHSTAYQKLEALSEIQIHSIEQPIKQGQLNEMSDLCANSPLPIALDEELIGVNTKAEKQALLTKIKPQYIILKPALHGGLSGSNEWIDIATELNIGWWATSALESNIGLNAIAQWLSRKEISVPQGLGTGQLFDNNIPSPLELRGEKLYYNSNKPWDLTAVGL